MKIITYNVNGLRACIKKGFLDWLSEAKADIVCMQEVRTAEEEIPKKKLNQLGYFNYWHCANKKGYSGVGILSKKKPSNVVYGTQIGYIDQEGRVLRVDFEEFSLINVYIPSGSNMEKRLEVKLKFMEDFYHYIKGLKNTLPQLIVVGDYNICHQAIDIHDPVRNAKHSGFLPEERQWFSKFLELGFLDSFRYFVKEPHHYSWWSYRAGAKIKNKGWRIDYNLVSKKIESKMVNASMLPSLCYSDHCPVVLNLNF